ncbi:MAG TPA: helix-turn-helix transcriptional regulator, partial [Candidatus Nanopelagicaceae bacterium]|nr:helix-turn-helix transcriptional regulator [Candidatus Nanopelagicaceae bacterium]
MAANPPWLGAVIGAALRQIRLEQGLTQEEIARLMRVSSVPWNQDTVGLLEKGRRRLLEIGELVALRALLGDLNINPERLCPGGSGDQVRVGGEITLSRGQIRELLGMLPRNRDGFKMVPGGLDSNALQDLPGVDLRGRPFPSDAELRAAKRLSKRLGREVTGVEVYWACGKLSSSLPGLDEWRERRLAEQLG